MAEGVGGARGPGKAEGARERSWLRRGRLPPRLGSVRVRGARARGAGWRDGHGVRGLVGREGDAKAAATPRERTRPDIGTWGRSGRLLAGTSRQGPPLRDRERRGRGGGERGAVPAGLRARGLRPGGAGRGRAGSGVSDADRVAAQAPAELSSPSSTACGLPTPVVPAVPPPCPTRTRTRTSHAHAPGPSRRLQPTKPARSSTTPSRHERYSS